MKKLIAVLSVALVLVFSCVLTSFADESVVNGYAVDNVPYNEAFDGVLTASDNGSQLYSASDNKTYNTPSVLAAPSTSSSALYTAKSVTDMIPWNIWRGNDSPTVTFPSAYGYVGVKYVWAENANPNSFYHQNEAHGLSCFKSGRKYRISFYLDIQARVTGTFNFYLASYADTSTPIIALVSAGGWVSNGNGVYSIDYIVPNDIPTSLTFVVKGTVYGTEFEFYIDDFTVTDITTEDLDNSLGKLGDRIDNIINPSTPYEKWDNGDLKDSKDKLNSAMGELPTVDINAVKSLKDSIDISSYSNAFAAINQLFIRVVDSIGVTPLIFFALFFGICIFLIGRKLSGG